MLARLVCWSVAFAVLFCIWLMYVDTLAGSEIAVGIGAAVLAATASEAVRGTQHPRFLPHLRWLLAGFLRLPGEILRDSLLLTRKLWGLAAERDLRTGRFISVPFRAGGTDAHSVALRALAILFTTLPPNTIVIGIDRRRNVMLLHQLVPAGTQADPILRGDV